MCVLRYSKSDLKQGCEDGQPNCKPAKAGRIKGCYRKNELLGKPEYVIAHLACMPVFIRLMRLTALHWAKYVNTAKQGCVQIAHVRDIEIFISPQ